MKLPVKGPTVSCSVVYSLQLALQVSNKMLLQIMSRLWVYVVCDGDGWLKGVNIQCARKITEQGETISHHCPKLQESGLCHARQLPHP